MSLISQAYIGSLSKEQLHSLCTRMLCGHGGVALAKSMMDSSNHGPGQPGNPPSDESVPWCVCNNCREMDTAIENVCCNKTPCVTSYESFFIGCVHHLILTLAILQRADNRVDPVDYSPASYRKAAY